MIQRIHRPGYDLIYSDLGLMIRRKGEDESYPNATEREGDDPGEYEEVVD